MVAWYKHDIPAWMDGTEDLDDGPYRIYHVVCQLIYLNEGPIALNERGIAGRCCQRIDRFRVHLKKLIDLGKLSVVDGKLVNSRCNSELGHIEANRVNAGKGGSAPRNPLIIDSSPAPLGSSPTVLRQLSEGSPHLSDSSPHTLSSLSDSKSLKDNGTGEASLQGGRSLKTREEETREDKKEHGPVASATRTEYPSDFESNFWKPYPRSPTMSKLEAFKQWQRMKPEERLAACGAIDAYKSYLRKNPTLQTVHACRFLSQERFAGFSEVLTAGGGQVVDIRSSIV